jgi:hypothetical protein
MIDGQHLVTIRKKKMNVVVSFYDGDIQELNGSVFRHF